MSSIMRKKGGKKRKYQISSNLESMYFFFNFQILHWYRNQECWLCNYLESNHSRNFVLLTAIKCCFFLPFKAFPIFPLSHIHYPYPLQPPPTPQPLTPVIILRSHLTLWCIYQANQHCQEWRPNQCKVNRHNPPDSSIKGLVARSRDRPHLNCLFVINMKRVSAQPFKDSPALAGE